MPVRIQEPWRSFLRDVDRALDKRVEVHCLGGFVLAVLWGLPRPTADVDFIDVKPGDAGEDLLRIAGEGTALAQNHRLHFQRVTGAVYPDGYERRLIDITPRGLHRLTLKAFEVHDVVLAKLSRTSPRNRADVEYLAKRGALVRRVLTNRYKAELESYVLNEAREKLTLDLWLDEILGAQEP